MQSHSINHNETFHINSLLYTYNENSSREYVSPKEYQKKTEGVECLRKVQKGQKVNKTKKKIVLGKAIVEGQEKMSLRELKALSRQIRPCHDIMSISRKLRENLTRAKSKMMDSLSKSNAEKDLKIYEYLLMDDLSTISSSVPSSPNLSSASSDYDDDDDDDNEEDDFSSVTTTESTFQLKLVTSDSGSVSVVPSSSHTPKLPPSHAIMSSPYDTALLPLYTPDFASIDMDFFFPKSTPLTHLHHHHHTTTNTTAASDVTEDQINSWLQRGGFGDSMTPLTMATDQELADLLDFDV